MVSASPSHRPLPALIAGLLTALIGVCSLAPFVPPVHAATEPAAKLAFATQPGGGAAWAAWATQPVVTVQDAAGNTVDSGASIALTITSGASGATLTCDPNPVDASAGTSTASAGTAAFSGCKIDTPGSGYTLDATSPGLTPATSSPFTILAGQNVLVFTTQPGGGPAGTAFANQPAVTVKDPGGNTVSSTASITLQIGANPAGRTLTCTPSLIKAAAAGVATFSGCKINKPGTGYTITAFAPGLTGVTSAPFNIIPGDPVAIVFSTQPGGGSAGDALSPQPVVTIQDIAGNTVTPSCASSIPVIQGCASITLGIEAGTGTDPGGGILTCESGLSRTAVLGVTTFSDCRISMGGSGYKLTATIESPVLAPVTSAVLQIGTAEAATKTAFTTSPPATAGAGTAFTTQPVVTIQDAAGNTVTSGSLTVTLSIVAPASTAAVLTCADGLTKLAVAGVAAFSGCAIDMTGTGYMIGAAVTGLTSATSTAITVAAGAAAKVGFTTNPVGAAGGAAFSKQPIMAVQDAAGNTATTNTGTVTLAISAGTGTAGAILTCTGGLSKAAVAGIATFAGCTIDKTGIGYKLTATATGLTAATSAALDISQGPATKLGFRTQPVGGPGGLPFSSQPVVAVQDAGGVAVAAGAAAVTLAITTGTGTAGAVLSCTGGLVQTPVVGLATFSGCAIDRAGAGYTLSATSGSLTLGVSNPFSVSTPVAVMTVKPAAAAIRYGAAATLGVAFSFAGANATVNLEESIDGRTWALVSPVTTDAAGSATFTYLIATTRWFRATYEGDRELLPGTSKAVQVAVQYSTILRPTNKGKTKTIVHGTAITFTATVRPTVTSTPRTQVTFEIYKFVGGKWAFAARRVATTNAQGTASLKWTFAKTGTWSVRARAAGTTQNSTGPWTGRETYRVT